MGTPTRSSGIYDVFNSADMEIWTIPVTTSGTQITLTNSGGGTVWGAAVWEISGAGATPSITGLTPQYLTSITSITDTFTNPIGAFCLGSVWDGGNNVVSRPASPWIAGPNMNNTNGDERYQIATAANVTATWTYGGTNVAIVGVFVSPPVAPNYVPSAARRFTAVSRAASWMESARGLFEPDIIVPRLALAR
jgi:hypothetical protein